MRIILVLILSFGSLYTMSKDHKVVIETIGVKTFDYKDSSRRRPVIVELWYPTEQQKDLDQPIDPVWIHPKEVRDVSLAESNVKYPLILMSHGNGGDRRDRSWLAESLVKKGYIVASVEHHGNSWSTYSAVSSLKFWERPRDVSFALDKLLKEPFLEQKIDPKKIGFVGYSLGGMTGLALGGAQAKNVKQVLSLMQKKFKELDPEVIEKFDFSEAGGNFQEPRIRAIALLCPATFIYPAESLKMIKTPIALVASDADEVLNHPEHSGQIMQHLAPAKIKFFKQKISHYAFLNRVSDVGKEMVAKELLSESPLCSRAKVHEEVSEFIVDFFNNSL